jgi:NAD+ diphosphatase
MSFVPGFTPPSKKAEPAYWFVFHNEKMLVKTNADAFCVPRTQDLDSIIPTFRRKHFIGTLNDRPCFTVELEDGRGAPDIFEFKGLRELFGVLPEDLRSVAGRANQLVSWSRIHRYCGGCGNATRDKPDELAKICPRCGLINYPRLSPAVIVAVTRGNQLLLARNQRFKSGFYSVLAGFVELGETLEDCVAREVYEEVNIKVKHIRYFGSQPWPFPDSLMVAFTAEHEAGEISANPSEIVEAGWYSANNLPRIPPRITIARWLIDWFINTKQAPEAGS